MEMTSDHATESPNSLLERMSRKRGVRSIIAIDRRNNTVIKSFVQSGGNIGASTVPGAGATNSAGTSTGNAPVASASTTSATYPADSAAESNLNPQQRGITGAAGHPASSVNGTAILACQLVNTATDLVREQIDGGEEVQLMRLRLNKSELVIVANEKYLLVTVYEPTQSGEAIDHGKLFSVFASSTRN